MPKVIYLFPFVGLVCAGCKAPESHGVTPTPQPQATATPVPVEIASPAPVMQMPTPIRKEPIPDPVVLEQLQKLRNADPSVDLQEAWQKGDLRFIGVNGYVGGQVLGIRDQNFNPFVRRYGVKVIPGTGDAITSEEQLQLQTIASQYAKRYNQLLLRKLQSLP
jgi:hypothetical protein